VEIESRIKSREDKRSLMELVKKLLQNEVE
jgi:hypothetical protein